MFNRQKTDDRLAPFVRSDISLVSQVVSAISSSRALAAGEPVPVENLPIVFGACTLHADTVASMPAVSTQPAAATFLEQPDVDSDYRTFVCDIVTDMFNHGDAVVLLDKPAPDTESAQVLDRDRARWATGEGWSLDGRSVPDNLIMCIPLRKRRNSPRGIGPLDQCATALGMYGHAYRFLVDYFAQGGNPWSILKTAQPLGNQVLPSGKTRAGEILDEWTTARTQGRPAVMDPTVSLEIPTATGELGSALTVLDYCSAETARLLNMPGSLVNAPSNGSLTYANVSDEMRRWIALSLKPTWSARLESAFRAMTGDPDVYLDPVPLLEIYSLLDSTNGVAE